MTNDEVLKILNYLGTAYNKSITPDIKNVYSDQMGDKAYHCMKLATKQIVANNIYFPKISELLVVYKYQSKKLIKKNVQWLGFDSDQYISDKIERSKENAEIVGLG